MADIIRLDYDDARRLVRIRTSDGGEYRVLAYDRYDRPVRIQRNRQSPTELTYDARGRIVRISRGGREVRYEYDAAGALVAVTDPDGARLKLEYDGAGRLTALALAEGHRIALELDSEGRPVRRSLTHTTLGELAAVSYLYDAEGRLSARQDAEGRPIAQYDYDAAGRLAGIRDGRGEPRAEFRYGALGQLLSITRPGAGAIRLRRDAGGRLAAVTDPRDNTHRTDYDDFGRAVARHNPDTGTTRYTYNTAGQPTSRTDAEDRTIHYRYDAAGRLVEKAGPDGTERFAYHPAGGGLAEVSGPWGRETFAYDGEGRLVRHERHYGDDTFTTIYEYDAAGRLVEKRLPGGQVLAYHYYEDGPHRGRLRAITRKGWLGQEVIVGEIGWDSLLGPTGYTHGNGIRTEFRYGPGGRLAAIETRSVLRLEYAYDALGRITGLAVDGELARYRYDALGRLTRADTRLGTFAYRYDAVGNRTLKVHTEPGGRTRVETYRYPGPGRGNRLLGIHARTDVAGPTGAQNERPGRGERVDFTYTPTGSPAVLDGLTYAYNAERRPVEVSQNGVVVAAYRYNGFGERIAKVVYSPTRGGRARVTYYLYDGHTLTGEAAPGGEAGPQYVYFAGRPVALLRGEETWAIHADHLGTPRAVTDAAGRLVWQAEYTPFGQARITRAELTLNLRLPGQYFDAETGTHYNYLRDYDPRSGRYLTSDPIGLRGGLNTYAYAEGDPLRLADPLGLAALPAPSPGPGPLPGPGTGPIGIPGGPAANDPLFSGRNRLRWIRPLGRALVRAGLIASADGLEPGLADIAGAAYLIGFAAGWAIDTAFFGGPEPTLTDLYYEVFREVRLYKPGYSIATGPGWQPSWRDYQDLLDTLYDAQVNYLRANRGGCAANYDAELYRRAEAAVTLRLQLDDLLATRDAGGDDSSGSVDDIFKRLYDTYRANGGSMSYEDWVYYGMPEGDSAALFERYISKLPPQERVAVVKAKLAFIAESRGWIKDGRLSKKNNRTIYRDGNGNYYAIDTQHGRFEKLDSRGKHIGEYDIDLNQTKGRDPSGAHDISV